MFAYRPTSTHCFDLVKAMTCGTIGGMILSHILGWPIPIISWATLAVSVCLSMYIMLCVEERWQHAGRGTRFFRWLVFRPKRLLQFLFWVLLWFACGAKPVAYEDDENPAWSLRFNRRQTLAHFWTISVSMYQYDCQNFLTIQECRDELKAKHEINQVAK